ncbi:hypothetical protein Aconfl_35330 [Algoriphagus confluentis]|uniref:Reverse transcriptase (RNA-dependent DNA polymerase) n=2 Tax=Algoriphagus confluentis TaxID=1697556 RepID=A0ABQ6PSC4_9BACT|nr:hypothetical protein Aconfl_35330 [Algoriphagus confluentis]
MEDFSEGPECRGGLPVLIMIEQVLNRKNLFKAYRKVVQNKGSAGVDDMMVTELFSFLESNRNSLLTSILNHSYVPKPIKGVEIPKSNGKTRLLGVPTVVDRWLQQAVSQVLMTKYELTFEDHSYGFRPEKNIHKALTQALKNIPVCRQAGMMATRTLWIST